MYISGALAIDEWGDEGEIINYGYNLEDLYFCEAMTTREFILTKLKSNKPKLQSLGVKTVGLFGSYVRNEQSTESDIDILIDFEPSKENFDNFISACNLFEDIFKNERVEVVTKNRLSPHIGPKILDEVLYV